MTKEQEEAIKVILERLYGASITVEDALIILKGIINNIQIS